MRAERTRLQVLGLSVACLTAFAGCRSQAPSPTPAPISQASPYVTPSPLPVASPPSAGPTASPLASASPSAAPARRPALLDPASATAKAPASFRVRFETTRGGFVVAVTRAWAPLGADRFYSLVRAGF